MVSTTTAAVHAVIARNGHSYGENDDFHFRKKEGGKEMKRKGGSYTWRRKRRGAEAEEGPC